MKTKSILVLFIATAFCAANTLAVSPFGTAFTYQGRLDDGGQPANGNYDLIFSLMNDPTNGSPIGPIMAMANTPVHDGYFTVELDFGPNAFDGSGRWLQIGVRTNCNCIASYTQLSPRQPVTPAPHALFAVNAAQAITANSANSANSVAWGNVTGTPATFADGIDNDTTYTAGAGLSLSVASNQFSVNFAGSGGANTAARSDHGHFGANWNGNSSGFGLVVANTSTTGSGLYAQQGTGSGASVPVGYRAAIWGESSAGDAVYGASGSAFGSGIYGYATHPTGANSGVYGASDSPLGNGVFGIATSAAGTNNHGVFGLCNSPNGGSGVYGRVSSVATNTDKLGLSAGVFGESHNSIGVVGTSDNSAGVLGDSVADYGVSGSSINSSGVFGTTYYGAALEGWTISGTGLGITTWGGDLINGYELFNGLKFRVTAGGDVFAAGAFHPNGADFAEMLPAQVALEPGDVLVIGADGKLARSTQPYQENVAGVHATKPGLLGGAAEGADLTGKIPLAVVGVVPVKVTSENGPIKPGDKLTTSSTPGHAMKAGRRAEVGTVIGKALGAMSADRGVVDMLVVLQ